MIFDNHGVPIWWIHSRQLGTRVLPNGNVLWFNAVLSSRWEIHRLDGSLVRTLNAVGHGADAHDLQLLPNGDYLVGAYGQAAATSTRAPTAARATPPSSTPSCSR